MVLVYLLILVPFILKYIILFILSINLTSCSGHYVIHQCKFGVALRDVTLENIDTLSDTYLYHFDLTRTCEFELGDLFYATDYNRQEDQIDSDQ